MSPVGHAAQMHMDLATTNFGVQEWPGINDAMYEVFTGIPEMRNGYAYVNDKPGLGVELVESALKRYPAKEEIWHWTQYRMPDSTVLWP
ncbi:D-galactonate dehydratase family member [bioreactor metagenome]|uniref:D-galactonate dehydratase family member n=1 Tax=bioreactor metagenome TaxID=1076179 RepID=A0A645H223_9ZZZZ